MWILLAFSSLCVTDHPVTQGGAGLEYFGWQRDLNSEVPRVSEGKYRDADECWSSAEMLWNHQFSSQLFSPAFLFWKHSTVFVTSRAVQPGLCTKQNPHISGGTAGLQNWAGAWQSALVELRHLCQGLTQPHLDKLPQTVGRDGWKFSIPGYRLEALLTQH